LKKRKEKMEINNYRRKRICKRGVGIWEKRSLGEG